MADEFFDQVGHADNYTLLLKSMVMLLKDMLSDNLCLEYNGDDAPVYYHDNGIRFVEDGFEH